MAGRRIDDHHAFMGKGSKDSVLPKGVHHKHESSAEGDGAITYYPDTTEKIHGVQEQAKHQAKKHPLKPGNRY